MSTEDEIEAARRRLYDVTHGVADALDKARAPVEGFAGLMKGMGKGQVDTTKGMEALGRALAEQLSVTGAVTKGMGSLTKQLAGGNADLTVFNTVIDTTAGLMGGLAKTIPVLGGILDVFIKAAAEGAKIVLARLNEVSKVFVDIGEVGGLAATGIDGITKQAVAAGLSLEQYKKIVIGNSTVLARFQNTVADGADAFTKVSGSIAKYDSVEGLALRRLGKGANELTEGVAGFITQQTTTGLAQRKTTDQLKVGAIEYIKELDILTRMTGVSGKTLQDQEKAAMAESRYLAQLRTMELAGLEGASASLKELSKVASAETPNLGKAIRELSTGIADTPLGQALQRSTGGAAMGIIAQVTSGMKGWPEAYEEIKQAMKGQEANMLASARIGDVNNESYIKLNEVVKVLTFDVKASYEAAKATQDKVLADSSEATKKMIEAQLHVEALARKTDKVAFDMLDVAATATAKLGGVLESLADDIIGWFGPKRIKQKPINLGAAPGAESAPQNIQNNAAALNNFMQNGRAPLNLEPKPAGGNQAEPANRSSSGTIRGLDHPAGPSGPSSAAPKTNPDEQGIKNTVLTKKAQLETMLGKKLVVTSGFRAGSKNHGSGDAIDLGLVANKLSELEKNKLIKSAIDLGFTGIGAEYNAEGGPHIHLDTSHASLVGWGSDYRSSSLGIDSPYAAALINARRSGQQDPGLASAANGGILSGPRSGYSATLHGTEAVVPLPDGRSIPISNSGSGGGSMEIQAAQLGALEELVSTMKNQVSISSKILQYAQ